MRAFHILILIAGTSALFAAPANAENCSCDQYKSLIPVAGLASDVAAIGATALHKEGGEFYHNSDSAVAARLRIDADKSIPDRCKKELKAAIPMHAVDLTVRATFLAPKFTASPYDSGTVGALHSVYNGYYQDHFLNDGTTGCGRPADASDAAANTAYTACVQAKAPNAWKKFGQFMNGSPEQIASSTGVTVENAKIMKAYHMLLMAGGEQAMIAAIKSGKDGLNTEQFLTLVQLYGHQLSNNYDYERIKKGTPSSKGAISGDQIHMAARDNTIHGLGTSGAGDPAGGLNLSEGVCRDIAAAQAKLLEAKGFKNTYVVHYATSEGGHATVITQDPSKPRQLYAINYDERSNRKDVDGAKALFQGASGAWANDYAINYRIYKPGGRLLADVPSEMGKFLTEAAGFDVKSLDGLARPAPQMIAANIGAGSEKFRIQARIVTGQDGIGAQYVGAGADVTWAKGTLFPGKAGGFFGQQHRPGDAFGRPVDSNVGVLYGQVEQHAMTPKFQLTPKLTLQGDASATAMVVGTFIHSGENAGSNNVRTDHRVTAEIRVEQTADGGKLKATYKAGVQGEIEQKDNRNQDASGVAPLLTKAYVGASAVYQVKPDLTLYGDALVIADPLGARGKLEVGAASRKIAGYAYVSGRLTNDTALLQDNSLRTFGLGFQVQPNQYLRFGLNGEVPLEGEEPLSRVRLFGTGALMF